MGFERNEVRQRMSNIAMHNARTRINLRFKWKNAQHQIRCAFDFMNARAAPRPDRRTDEMPARRRAHSRPRLKSGASTPTKTEGGAARKVRLKARRSHRISGRWRAAST